MVLIYHYSVSIYQGMKNIYILPYNLHQDILSSLRKDDSFFDVKITQKIDDNFVKKYKEK